MALQPEVSKVSELKEEIETILEKTEKINTITTITSRRIDLLAELTKVLPDDAWIKYLSMEDNYFQIEGSGLSGTSVLTVTGEITYVQSGKIYLFSYKGT